MCCDLERRARETIATILAELDPDRITQRFDDPIDWAARESGRDLPCPISHTRFHQALADFVTEIHDKLWGACWMLTDPLAEGIWLLQNLYHIAIHDSGYTAAVMDANDSAEGGMQTVLMVLAESIKAVERQKYTQAVLVRNLYTCSWQLRCQIARVLLTDYGAFLPRRLAQCAPEQLAYEIPALISTLVSSNLALYQALRARRSETVSMPHPL